MEELGANGTAAFRNFNTAKAAGVDGTKTLAASPASTENWESHVPEVRPPLAIEWVRRYRNLTFDAESGRPHGDWGEDWGRPDSSIETPDRPI
jgi:hypothetical protein